MYGMETTASISACDEHGRLKLCSALQMMQDCSELWIDSEPEVKRFFEEQGMCQVLASRQVDVVREPVRGERLRVETSIYEMKPKFGFRNTFVYGADGAPCYRTWSMGAFADRTTGKLRAVNDDVIASMTLENRLDMDYLDRRIAVPADGGIAAAEPFRAMRSDIDYNRHVNNVNYVRMGLDLLPEDFRVRRLRVEYRVPARLGDVLEPVVFDGRGTWTVLLRIGGRTSAVMEFAGE